MKLQKQRECEVLYFVLTLLECFRQRRLYRVRLRAGEQKQRECEVLYFVLTLLECFRQRRLYRVRLRAGEQKQRECEVLYFVLTLTLTLFCSGDRTRTCDLRVMSPTSYQLLYPAIAM